jgi:GxxExxY protein
MGELNESEKVETGEERPLVECSEELIDKVLTAATNVHRALGPGLLESVYELALIIELESMGIPARRQVEIPVYYKGRELGTGFRADIIVAECLLLELKSIDAFAPIHLAIALNYLKLLRFKRGLLLNFNVPLLKNGIKRVSN